MIKVNFRQLTKVPQPKQSDSIDYSKWPQTDLELYMEYLRSPERNKVVIKNGAFLASLKFPIGAASQDKMNFVSLYVSPEWNLVEMKLI